MLSKSYADSGLIIFQGYEAVKNHCGKTRKEEETSGEHNVSNCSPTAPEQLTKSPPKQSLDGAPSKWFDMG
jgi:hypothetical protein